MLEEILRRDPGNGPARHNLPLVNEQLGGRGTGEGASRADAVFSQGFEPGDGKEDGPAASPS